ncbi:unnamed protein product [Linum trigynum]|uniref:Uncharacterized protein n=1 Tax=Linum trigynum TaxID=586398 RepID=A0AAV2GPA5_9ROSI
MVVEEDAGQLAVVYNKLFGLKIPCWARISWSEPVGEEGGGRAVEEAPKALWGLSIRPNVQGGARSFDEEALVEGGIVEGGLDKKEAVVICNELGQASCKVVIVGLESNSQATGVGGAAEAEAM